MKRRTRLQIEMDRNRIASMSLVLCMSGQEIAGALELSVPTVEREIHKLRSDKIDRMSEEHREKCAYLYAERLEHFYLESVEAWLKSKNSKQITTKTVTETGDGRIEKTEIVNKMGNPQFLVSMGKYLDKLYKHIGLTPDEQIEVFIGVADEVREKIAAYRSFFPAKDDE